MAKLNLHTVLVAHNNPLTVITIAQAVQDAGGNAAVCGTAQEALVTIGQGNISAAILGDGVCQSEPDVCNQLRQRGIPYVEHDGLVEICGSTASTNADALIDKIADLLAGRGTGASASH